MTILEYFLCQICHHDESCWSREEQWRLVVWRLVLGVVCGRTMVTQGHGNLSFSSALSASLYLPSLLIIRSQGDRNTLGKPIMLSNNKQCCSCSIDMSLHWDCRTFTLTSSDNFIKFYINTEYIFWCSHTLPTL